MRAKTEAARLNQAIRRPVANALAPSVQHLLQTLCGPPLRSCGPLPRAVTPCYFELPVARRLSSAVRALSPGRTRRFDSCQVQLGTRSAIFAVGQHFVQEAPFAIPTAPGADLSDRLRVRVPSEVATETLLCRCSYGQAVQSGIKLPLRNFKPVSAHQTVVGRFNRFFEREPGFQHQDELPQIGGACVLCTQRNKGLYDAPL